MGTSNALVHFKDQTCFTVYQNTSDVFYTPFSGSESDSNSVGFANLLLDQNQICIHQDCCKSEPAVLEVLNYGGGDFGIKSHACRECQIITGPRVWDREWLEQNGGGFLDGKSDIQEALQELKA